MIKGMNHFGISVVNLARSIRFYRDLLDMQLVVDETPFGGELYEKIMALEGAKGKVSLLKKGNLQLELFEFAYPLPRPKDPNYPVSDHGLSHFCIEVADIDGMYERLRTAGVAFHCPPLNFFGRAKATYGRDPDGNVFELHESSGTANPS
jgi:catechol 2,3-dioxygenase-like lactoylglutathione lyase family enzyme